MAAKYKRQLAATKIPPNFKQRDEDIEDYGAYRVLECQGRRLKSQSTSAILALEHSATNEVDGWLPLSAMWNLDGSGNDFVTVTDFLRYVRVAADEDADGTAVFQLDIVAKE